MTKPIFKAATFRPAEIQKITGLTPDTLRDLRKRGYVEKTEGWTAASLVETARLIIVARLSAIGIPPAASWEIARHKDAAQQLVGFALELEGTIGKAAKVGLHLPKRYRFLCISNLKPVNAFFANEAEAKKIYFTQGEVPLLTLDLQAYATLLVDNAGKPLIQIEEG